MRGVVIARTRVCVIGTLLTRTPLSSTRAHWHHTSTARGAVNARQAPREGRLKAPAACLAISSCTLVIKRRCTAPKLSVSSVAASPCSTDSANCRLVTCADEYICAAPRT
jgi:hypothetical protein